MKKRIHLKTIVLMCFISSITLNAQWYKVDSKTTKNIYDIFFVDKNVGYCIAGDGILKSTDGGDSWNKIYNNNIRSFGSIVAYKDVVIAFGRDQQKRIRYKYTSVDNGNTWGNEVIDYFPDYVQSNNNNVFFIDINDSWKLKKLSNGVITTIFDFATVYGINRDEIVSIGRSADTLIIHKSVDSGLTWKALASFPSNIGSNQLTGAEIKSFNDTIILATTYPNDISFSYDNGKNWTQNSNDEPWLTTIVNSSTLYGADASGIYISNLGSGWILQASLIEDRIEKLYFYDDNLGFAIGENGIIYKTNNGGSLKVLNVNEHKKLEKKIKLFPVPSKKIIKLEIPSDILVKDLQMYDIQGKLIKIFKSSERKLKINDITAGNYLLKIKTNKGAFTKRIIIK